jgi:hypothetical protein
MDSSTGIGMETSWGSLTSKGIFDGNLPGLLEDIWMIF